ETSVGGQRPLVVLRPHREQGTLEMTLGTNNWRRMAAVALALPALGFAAAPAHAASGDCVGALQVTCTFTYTGGPQTWTPPAGVSQATVTLYGAQGGSATGNGAGAGGLGAKVTSTLSWRTALPYQINVGGGGGDYEGKATFGGGGAGTSPWTANDDTGGASG